jgi:imidazolonepropionase-like amidohydrolase
VIDAKGMTLLPGLFDLHTHLPYATGGGLTGDWAKNLKAYLYCGITSVVDFGTYAETFEPMRRLIRNGRVEGPRLHLAVRITSPGGHGAEGGRGDFFSLEVSTPGEARAAIRSVLNYQPDVIKAFSDGWRYGNAPDMTSLNQETLTALVDEAHKFGLEVLTHTVTLEKAKIASSAGVDVIAHGIGDAPANQELIDLMKSKGTTYAPTLAVYEPRDRAILDLVLATVLDPLVRSRITPPLTPPSSNDDSSQPATNPRWQNLQNNTSLLRKAGIKFGVGTDAGVTGTHHGWATLRELQLLVAGGLTPLEAIEAATGNAARALKVDNERGSIAPGKLADLVLVEGEPHKNIADIEKIQRVFLGGLELDRENLAREIAADSITPIPAIKAQEVVDDFEAQNGRSRLDTLWINSTEPGVSPTKIVFGRTLRENSNHALSVTARMSLKERPYARINIPLSRGAVEPVDAQMFRGVKFDTRGDGDYRLLIPTYSIRDNAHFYAPFNANPQWQEVNIEFSSLKRDGARLLAQWTGGDVLMLSFEIARPAGTFGWLELDNVRFYR